MAKRRTNDFYATPDWAARALVERVPISGPVLECCAGGGALVPALAETSRIKSVYTNDIDTSRGCHYAEDVTRPDAWARLPHVDWIVTNPPFNVAPLILPLALTHARFGMAMLLRLSYLEPCENRGRWLAEHPLSKHITLERISFTGDGKTDNVTCAWFVWAKFPLQGAPIVTVPKRNVEECQSGRFLPAINGGVSAPVMEGLG